MEGILEFMKNLLYQGVGIFFIGSLSILYSLILQTSLAIKGQYFCLSILILGVFGLLTVAARNLKPINLFCLCCTLALTQSLICVVLTATDPFYPQNIKVYMSFWSTFVYTFVIFLFGYTILSFLFYFIWKSTAIRFRIFGKSIHAVSIICLATLLILNYHRPWQSPDDVLIKFYEYGDSPSTGAAEDMLMDPLILGGEKVAPLITKEIKNKEMEMRRYAIGFLGICAYKQAVPVLTKILLDDTEEFYFRMDALESIYFIDKKMAQKYAQQFIDRDDSLGSTAKKLCSEDCRFLRDRSYLNAWFGIHK